MTAAVGRQQGDEAARAIPLQGSTRLPEAFNRLVQLYTKTNKLDAVKKWQAEKEKQTFTQPIK